MKVFRLSAIGALLAVLALGIQLIAQTPSPCAAACLKAYKKAVVACNGNASCLASARAAAVSCIKGCGL